MDVHPEGCPSVGFSPEWPVLLDGGGGLRKDKGLGLDSSLLGVRPVFRESLASGGRHTISTAGMTEAQNCHGLFLLQTSLPQEEVLIS